MTWIHPNMLMYRCEVPAVMLCTSPVSELGEEKASSAAQSSWQRYFGTGTGGESLHQPDRWSGHSLQGVDDQNDNTSDLEFKINLPEASQ